MTKLTRGDIWKMLPTDGKAAYLSNIDLRNIDMNAIDLSGSDLSGSDLSGSNMGCADLRGSDLSGAKLMGANLVGAIMIGTNLTNADLRGAKIKWNSGNGREIRNIRLGCYTVVICITHNVRMMAIGCQQHTIDEWMGFRDDEIDVMDFGALEWWYRYKDTLETIIDNWDE